jgi:hypothetical protein
MFIDCDVRWPGSVHDGRVFRTSDIYEIGQNLCEPNYHIIGDAAYPCKSWVMTPFRNNGHLTPAEVYYNTHLSKTRVVIENAFALLKGRFRRLKYMLERKHIADYTKTIVACCVLHNICILQHEDDLQPFIDEGEDPRDIHMIPNNNAMDNTGNLVRNNLVNLLWNQRFG